MNPDPSSRVVGPTAFVSYAQSHPEWAGEQTEGWMATVLRFAVLLCEMGIDTDVDQFYAHDLEVDWNRFGPTAARERDFVLIAVSRAYRERWEGSNEPREGAGAVREANELMGQFNHDQADFRRRVKVVVLPGASRDDIPAELGNLQRFQLGELTQAAAMDLFRTLTNQPATPKPALGPLIVLDSDTPAPVDCAALHDLYADLERIQGALAQVPEIDRIQAERGNFSLPWVRSAYQLLGQEQAILASIAELEGQAGPEVAIVKEDGGTELERVIARSLTAAGDSSETDVVEELARRLREPTTGPPELLRLFRDLPGGPIDISVQKRVKYDLHRQGVLARNPAGRGYVVGELP
jgi:SEFIR domain